MTYVPERLQWQTGWGPFLFIASLTNWGLGFDLNLNLYGGPVLEFNITVGPFYLDIGWE